MRELPSGWADTKIGQLCDLVNGRAFKPSDWVSAGLPIVRIQNLNRLDAKFNFFAGAVQEKFLIKTGDLLFAWSGTPGTSFGCHIWAGPKAILNQHIFNVHYNNRALDKQFFRYAINQTLDEQIAKAHGGVGLRHVTKGKFEDTAISLPPLPEQRRIVAKISSLSSKSRRARDHLDHVPRLVEKYKQAILAAAFRGDLTREWRIKNRVKEYQVGQVQNLVESPIRNGLSIRGSDEPPGFRSLRLSALRTRIADMSDSRFLPIDAKRAARFELRQGDVLVSRGNGTKTFVGIASIVPRMKNPTIFPDTAFRIRLASNKAYPDWFALIWNSPQVRTQIEMAAKTTAGIWKISQADLAGIELLIPDAEEQRVIVRLIEIAFNWIDRLASETSNARKLIDHLDQSILAKAFRGELVPQDPGDEPASILLERIKTERFAAPEKKRNGAMVVTAR
jgi:type I restriction enzyme S subunit